MARSFDWLVSLFRLIRNGKKLITKGGVCTGKGWCCLPITSSKIMRARAQSRERRRFANAAMGRVSGGPGSLVNALQEKKVPAIN